MVLLLSGSTVLLFIKTILFIFSFLLPAHKRTLDFVPQFSKKEVITGAVFKKQEYVRSIYFVLYPALLPQILGGDGILLENDDFDAVPLGCFILKCFEI